MNRKKERGLRERYNQDPEKADADIWQRKPDPVSRSLSFWIMKITRVKRDYDWPVKQLSPHPPA